MRPTRAREILADPHRTAASERYRVIGEVPANTRCLFRGELGGGVKLIKDTRVGGVKELHPGDCASKWFESPDLPLEEEGPSASGIPFMVTRSMKEELRKRGFSDEEITELTPAQVHEILRDSS